MSAITYVLTSEWNHGDSQESRHGVTDIIPVDLGSVGHHHRSYDDQDGSGSPGRDVAEDGREEDGDEEQKGGRQGCDPCLSTFRDTRSAFYRFDREQMKWSETIVEDLPTNGVQGDVPKNNPDKEIQNESTRNATELPSKSPSLASYKFALLLIATSVPVV